MKNFGSTLAEAYAAWFDSLTSCFAPRTSRQHREPPRSESRFALGRADLEKDDGVSHDQPRTTPPPSFARHDPRELMLSEKKVKPFKGKTSLRRLGWGKTSRRPHISAPSDFRHLNSTPFDFPGTSASASQPRRRPSSFRPLELSIYMPDNQLTPMVPHFHDNHPDITPPPPARTHGSFDSDRPLAHQRSLSSMSFHLPRRVPLQSSPSLTLTSETLHDSPPKIPPRSRLRAYTSPSVEHIYERVASAMIERDRLQAEIETVAERQSVYAGSRPSTAYGLEDIDPMPAIPAIPAPAPSFAERLSSERPRTAPSRPIDIPRREKSFAEASSTFAVRSAQGSPLRGTLARDANGLDVPLAPPLPLVLRPPLRKKKSFSRVSNWLLLNGQHQRDVSLDSVTNAPKPVTGREGFYQIAEGRQSAESVSSMSTWTTEGERTVPSTCSPGSSPLTKLGMPTPPTIDRTSTFGRGGMARRLPNVGVAF